jgi:hypothetical protein
VGAECPNRARSEFSRLLWSRAPSRCTTATPRRPAGAGGERSKLLDGLARRDGARTAERNLKIGTVLVRDYQGRRHTVTVEPDGYVWEGNPYFQPVGDRTRHHRDGPERPPLLRRAVFR